MYFPSPLPRQTHRCNKNKIYIIEKGNLGLIDYVFVDPGRTGS